MILKLLFAVLNTSNFTDGCNPVATLSSKGSKKSRDQRLVYFTLCASGFGLLI